MAATVRAAPVPSRRRRSRVDVRMMVSFLRVREVEIELAAFGPAEAAVAGARAA